MLARALLYTLFVMRGALNLKNRWLVVLLAFSAFSLLFQEEGASQGAASLAWQTTAADSTGSVGEYPVIDLDSQGRPHIFYYDRANRYVRYARNLDGTGWVVTPFPNPPATTQSGEFIDFKIRNDDTTLYASDVYSMLADPATPRIGTRVLNGDGSQVSSTGFTAGATHHSIALGPNNNAHIVFKRGTSTAIAVPCSASAADDAGKLIHRWQKNPTTVGCRVASGIVEGPFRFTLDQEGYGHLVYVFSDDVDDAGGEEDTIIRYKKSGNNPNNPTSPTEDDYTWPTASGDAESFTVVNNSELNTTVGRGLVHLSMAVDTANVHICFHDPNEKSLKYWGGSHARPIQNWSAPERVDGTADASDTDDTGRFCSIAIGPGNVLHLAYYSSDMVSGTRQGRIKYARKRLNLPAAAWELFTVDASIGVYGTTSIDFYQNRYLSLDVSNEGAIHLAYYHRVQEELRHAVLSAAGNGLCDPGESISVSPQDCPGCGDGVCSASETVNNCFTDCHCGNGVCDSNYGETSQNCSADCLPPTPACVTNADCPGLSACINATCQSCTDNAQCETGRICQEGACVTPPVRTGCTTNTECPGGAICDEGTCVSCMNDAECGEGKVCRRGACITPDPSLCGNGICNPEVGENMQTCLADCPGTVTPGETPPIVPPAPPEEPPQQAGGRGCGLIR